MDVNFLTHNAHLNTVKEFRQRDPHLRRLYSQVYQFESTILDELPVEIPGIYNLVGGRQIGKTTLLKQWMERLLKKGVEPNAIRFISCELIPDMHSLNRVVNQLINEMPQDTLLYIILDEITYVENWDRAIKYLADSGQFEKAVVVISGSDLVIMQEARMRFPGRRGKADKVDFHFYPLSFREVINLKLNIEKVEKSVENEKTIKLLYEEFENYLIHGGYLAAINEYAENKKISQATLSTYSDWVRGDVIKRNKSEHSLREIISAIVKHYTKQISWRNIVKDLSIDHYQTAIDYTHLLESMDVVFIQAALIEDKLVGAPKKNRRLMFTDPFIYHALNSWLIPSKDPFIEHILPMINDSKACSELVESSVINHYRRYYPTYYIKADGEVDIAYIYKNKFWPVEVKWRQQIRPNEFKQIQKYPNGVVFSKVNAERCLDGLRIIPLPVGLLGLEQDID